MIAILIGATGLVGTHLIEELINDATYARIIILTRRTTGKEHSKIEEHLIDFNNPGQWKHLVKGDVLFSALGTTLRKAGSKEAQFLIDYTYQYHCAKAASENNVAQYILVSAAYASPDSKIFYSRMKGVLEKDIAKLSFQKITIIKPGIIDGDRNEKRVAERISISIFKLLHHLPGLHFAKPIHASIIAKAMMAATIHHPDHVNVYQFDEVFKLAEKGV